MIVVVEVVLFECGLDFLLELLVVHCGEREFD